MAGLSAAGGREEERTGIERSKAAKNETSTYPLE
jgi:hypothetical protein